MKFEKTGIESKTLLFFSIVSIEEKQTSKERILFKFKYQHPNLDFDHQSPECSCNSIFGTNLCYSKRYYPTTLNTNSLCYKHQRSLLLFHNIAHLHYDKNQYFFNIQTPMITSTF